MTYGLYLNPLGQSMVDLAGIIMLVIGVIDFLLIKVFKNFLLIVL